MQECPKCGFLQPQDRFCANCGLDIDHYRPKPAAWYRSLIFNSAFQIALIVITIGAMVGYISWQQSQLIRSAQQPQFIGKSAEDRAADNAPSDQASTSAQSPSGSSTGGAVSSATNPNSGAETSNPEAGAAALAGEGAGKAGTGSEKSAVPTPTQLIVRFAEFPREMLNHLLSEAQILHDGNQIQVATYKFSETLEKLLKTNSRARFLPGNGSATLSGQIRLQFAKALTEGSTEGSTELHGLSFGIDPTNVTAANVELETEGGFFLAGKGGDPTVNIPLEGTYSLPHGSLLLFAGIVPHRQLSEKEAAAFRGTPLDIMNSPDFLANETEFIMLVKAQ